MTDKTAALWNMAKAARQHAYAPHSDFEVGAALLDDKDNTHIGCNVENDAYPSGTCAEENAIGAMIVSGGRTIKQIVIVGGKTGDTYKTCVPCGACRQRIAEFSDARTEIVLLASDNTRKHYTLAQLLPDHFKF